MKFTLLIVVGLCLIVSLEAKREREDSERQRGDRGRDDGQFSRQRGRRNNRMKVPFPMFPSCNDFNEEYMMKMRELRRLNKIGPNVCKDQDRTVCHQKDRDTVRCALTDEIPEECLQEINDFLEAASCTTTTETTP
ncbi:hypothetical protein JTE90_013665 [Oedothorax gibbosus]|uniref:Uncharacterized protein n=1 Tax=Oedothorax gibbosus TaxID=931172 RepID=A0AAV6VDI8_9ARAC|nr:hypothetical protein JTE90_013665 [Oedothorax gibbosus]